MSPPWKKVIQNSIKQMFFLFYWNLPLSKITINLLSIGRCPSPPHRHEYTFLTHSKISNTICPPTMIPRPMVNVLPKLGSSAVLMQKGHSINQIKENKKTSLAKLENFNILREAFNKKTHFFYGIFHNGQTPPPVMEKKHFFDAWFLTHDFRHVISETLRNI